MSRLSIYDCVDEARIEGFEIEYHPGEGVYWRDPSEWRRVDWHRSDARAFVRTCRRYWWRPSIGWNTTIESMSIPCVWVGPSLPERDDHVPRVRVGDLISRTPARFIDDGVRMFAGRRERFYRVDMESDTRAFEASWFENGARVSGAIPTSLVRLLFGGDHPLSWFFERGYARIRGVRISLDQTWLGLETMRRIDPLESLDDSMAIGYESDTSWVDEAVTCRNVLDTLDRIYSLPDSPLSGRDIFESFGDPDASPAPFVDDLLEGYDDVLADLGECLRAVDSAVENDVEVSPEVEEFDYRDIDPTSCSLEELETWLLWCSSDEFDTWLDGFSLECAEAFSVLPEA